MNQLAKSNAIILAAGKGSRMKSEVIKVLHHIAGKPVLQYVLDAVNVCCGSMYVVVGYQSDAVKKQFSKQAITFVEQKEQLGTGHAVDQVVPFINNEPGSNTVILAGDCPLIKPATLTKLFQTHQQMQ